MKVWVMVSVSVPWELRSKISHAQSNPSIQLTSWQQVPICTVVKSVRAVGRDKAQISWQGNSGICHLLQQQINDNYPADMSTVITLQDQEQGEREMKKEGMKGSGPHLAQSWSILCEIWLWPAPRPGLIAAQQAITAFLHGAAGCLEVHGKGLCVLICVCFQQCQKEIHLVWQLTHQYQPSKIQQVIPHRRVFKEIIVQLSFQLVFDTCSLDTTRHNRCHVIKNREFNLT